MTRTNATRTPSPFRCPCLDCDCYARVNDPAHRCAECRYENHEPDVAANDATLADLLAHGIDARGLYADMGIPFTRDDDAEAHSGYMTGEPPQFNVPAPTIGPVPFPRTIR